MGRPGLIRWKEVSSTESSPRAIGRYLLFGELAAGGMASVHLGRLVGPVGFSRTVAIKRLHPQLARDADGVAAFMDEARLTARVQHPNVAQTLDVVEMPGEIFLVMEYVRGETLSHLVRAVVARGEQPPARIVTSIITGALYGLHAAHEAKSERGEPLGIVHRDVSPQNIIVGVDGVARVLDFGVAKAASRVTTTSEGQVKGKLAYMPPEQISSGQVDRRTDVYAAAVVLWETLTARRLFAGDSQGAIIGRILRGDVEPPRKYAPELSAELEAVVLRGLALDPAARFPTALDMATELERLGSAAPREVGAWVESIAGAVLATRAAMVSDMESASHTVATGVRRTTEPSSAGAAPPTSPPPAVPPDEPTHTDRSLSAVSSPHSVRAANEAPPPKARPSKWLLVPVLALVACGVALLVMRGSRTSPASDAPAASTSSSIADTAPALSTTATNSPAEAPSASVATVPSAAPSSTAKKKPPAGPKRDCNPPFRVDADGIRHMKQECF